MNFGVGFLFGLFVLLKFSVSRRKLCLFGVVLTMVGNAADHYNTLCRQLSAPVYGLTFVIILLLVI